MISTFKLLANFLIPPFSFRQPDIPPNLDDPSERIYYYSKNSDIYCPKFDPTKLNINECIKKLNIYFSENDPTKIKILNNINNLDEHYILNRLERIKFKIIKKIAEIHKNKTLKNNFSSLTEKHLLKDIFDIDDAYYKIIEILSFKNVNDGLNNKTLSSDSDFDLLTDALILSATLNLNPIDQKNNNLQSLVYDIFGLNEFKNKVYDGTNYANKELDSITLQKPEAMINLPINIISRSYSQLLYSLIFDTSDLTYFFYFYEDNSLTSLATSKKAINSFHYLFLLYIFNVEVAGESYFKELALNLIKNNKKLIINIPSNTNN